MFLAPASAVTPIFSPLREAGFELNIAENLKSASVFINKFAPAAIFSRPSMPGYRIEALLAMAADTPGFPPVVVITENGTGEEAENLLNQGARDYWIEPLDVGRILAFLRPQAQKQFPVPSVSTLGGNKPTVQASAPGFRIVGKHPAIAKVLKLARKVAASKATVLISGESGTGKEMFARYLHAMSKRANNPFIAVNCAALPEHLLESELFGHEKGAFTGAIARKLGKFELASGGTILLDEISEMDLALQAKLLRVLQEGEIDRVGGSETVSVDVRVLATTNRNLESWVKEGKFRQDLYFRLNVIPLRLPSLKERGDDVIDLAQFFIKMYREEYSLSEMVLSDVAIDWLRNYDFPGNVRELQNLMERAVLLANGQAIAPCHFLLEDDSWPLFEDDEEASIEVGGALPNIETGEDHASSGQFSSASQNDGDCASSQDEELGDIPCNNIPNAQSAFSAVESQGSPVIPLHEMERIMIIRGLEATSGNRTQAAELLGISVRTLRNKLNEYRAGGHPID